MERLRSAGDVFHERRTLLGADIDNLADGISVGDDAASGMALLPEQDQCAHGELADGDAEGVEQLAAHAVAALAARGFLFCHGMHLVSIIIVSSDMDYNAISIRPQGFNRRQPEEQAVPNPQSAQDPQRYFCRVEPRNGA